MEHPLSRFSMEGNVNTKSFRSSRSSWAGHRLKQPGPGRLEEGRHADGEVFLFTRTGPPETTLLPRYQVISLTHFTGGEAHRLPHLNVTCLWERKGRGGAARAGTTQHAVLMWNIPKVLFNSQIAIQSTCLQGNFIQQGENYDFSWQQLIAFKKLISSPNERANQSEIGFVYAAESRNHRKTMFHVLHNTTMSHKYPGWAFQSHLSKPPRKVPARGQTSLEYCRSVLALKLMVVIWKPECQSWWSENYHSDTVNCIIYCLGMCVCFKHAWLRYTSVWTFCCQLC